MRLIVAGTRSYMDKSRIFKDLDRIYSRCPELEIVSGLAKGPDMIGKEWGDDRGVTVLEFPALWKNLDVKGAVIKTGQYGQYNAVAGHQRNEKMAIIGDASLIYWNGSSTGTRDMIARTSDHDLMLAVVYY